MFRVTFLCKPTRVILPVRGKHRVYIQKPFPRPKMMQVVEDLSQPILGSNLKPLLEEPCQLPTHKLKYNLTEYEEFLARRLAEMFTKVSTSGLVAAIQPPSVNGRDWREIRIKFAKRGIQLRTFHPRVISHVISETKYSELSRLLPAPIVLGFCEESLVGELSDALKECPNMTLLACCLPDRMLSSGQLEALVEKGRTLTDHGAQTIGILRGIPASLSMLLSSNNTTTVKILNAYLEKNQTSQDS